MSGNFDTLKGSCVSPATPPSSDPLTLPIAATPFTDCRAEGCCWTAGADAKERSTPASKPCSLACAHAALHALHCAGMWVDGMDVLAVKNAVAFAKQYAVENGPLILESAQTGPLFIARAVEMLNRLGVAGSREGHAPCMQLGNAPLRDTRHACSLAMLPWTSSGCKTVHRNLVGVPAQTLKARLCCAVDTYRYHGHSISDPGSTYRTRDEIQGETSPDLPSCQSRPVQIQPKGSHELGHLGFQSAFEVLVVMGSLPACLPQAPCIFAVPHASLLCCLWWWEILPKQSLQYCVNAAHKTAKSASGRQGSLVGCHRHPAGAGPHRAREKPAQGARLGGSHRDQAPRQEGALSLET